MTARTSALTPEDRRDKAHERLHARDRCIGNAEAYDGEADRTHTPRWKFTAQEAAAWWRGKAGENSAAAVALMPSLACPCANCGAGPLTWCHDACPCPRTAEDAGEEGATR